MPKMRIAEIREQLAENVYRKETGRNAKEIDPTLVAYLLSVIERAGTMLKDHAISPRIGRGCRLIRTCRECRVDLNREDHEPDCELAAILKEIGE